MSLFFPLDLALFHAPASRHLANATLFSSVQIDKGRALTRVFLPLDLVFFLAPASRHLANLGCRNAVFERADQQEQGVNPLQRIMERYVGTGPYSLLYRLHEEKRRANVMIRRVNR